ncbi:MAG TPA: CHAT domain-containing tetratricopeptide repeat protein [Bryobacteraceae bacterium]
MPGFHPLLSVSALICALATGSPGQSAGAALLKQAQADLAAGNYESVIQGTTQAAAIFRSAADWPGLARALTGTGLAHLYSGDYQAALTAFTEALDLASKNHDPQAEAGRLNNIGAVDYELGRYSEAMERYRESLQRSTEFSAEHWATPNRKLAMANIAIVHETLGQYEEALDLYSQLLADSERMDPHLEAQLLSNIGTMRRRLGDPQKALATYRAAQADYRRDARLDGEIAVLINIGIVQAMDFHDTPAALSTFREAKRLAAQSGNRPLAVQTLLYGAEALYRSGEIAAAADDYQAALKQAQALGKKEEIWKAQYGLARIAWKRSENEAARQLLRDAITGIESLRSGLLDIGLRTEFLGGKRDVYDLAMQLTDQPEEIFRLMESSRGRVLRDRLKLAAPSLHELSLRLPDDTAILEFSCSAEAACGLLWITHRQSGFHRFALSQPALAALAELPAELADATRSGWWVHAALLAESLLAGAGPIQDPAIRQLVIVPDGPLQSLPFEVLPHGPSQLLIERFVVSYLPSAGIYTQGDRAWHIRWPWQDTIRAIADPAPGAAAKTRVWPRLPQAGREVAGIADALNGRAHLHEGSDATRAYLAGGGILHLATHAVADRENALKSFILFAPRHRGEAYDSLYLKEVYDLRLQDLRLATLSACETSTGKQAIGEGLESFSRAFLAAGAHSVVASLWRVDDRVTADWMPAFYQRLAAGRPLGAALREAKLASLGDPRLSHPANWAGFILTGESQSRIPFTIGWLQLVLAFLIVGSAFLAFRTRAGRE